MIVAVHRQALEATLGNNTWNVLEPELRTYLDTVASASGTVPALLYLDAPLSSGLAGHNPAPSKNPAAAARLIRARALQMNPRPSAVLLIGGDEALPMHRLQKPETVVGDHDADIPSDNPYGCFEEDERRYGDPDMAVGRFVAGPGDGANALLYQVQQARIARQSGRSGSGSFVLTNNAWVDASTIVANTIDVGPQIIQSSPFYRVAVSNVQDLDRAVLFFNLHGRADATWLGGVDADWPAVTPQPLASVTLPASLVFACNCYGASIAGRNARTLIGLAMLQRGALGFVGSTGYSFGSTVANTVAYSEELAARFFRALASGSPGGIALQQARHEYVTAHLRPDGTVSPLDYKTATQFLYLGDPLL